MQSTVLGSICDNKNKTGNNVMLLFLRQENLGKWKS